MSNIQESSADIQCPIIKRIIIGLNHKEIKEVFNLTDSEFQAKLDEVYPPKVVKKKAAKKKKLHNAIK